MTSEPLRSLDAAGMAPLRWLLNAWGIVFFGAMLLALALSHSIYRRPAMRY